MTITLIPDIVTAGDQVDFVFTLSGTGNIALATLTASITPVTTAYPQPAPVITAHALTITDAIARVVQLRLTAAESALLLAPDPEVPTYYVGDVKMVLAGVLVRYGPFRFGVRAAVTV